MSFEESLVRHASPTLANLKVANLYNFRFRSPEECERTLRQFNEMMNPKGIYIELLKSDGKFFLIYVYRKTWLRTELQRGEVREFLTDFGYPDDHALHCNFNVLKKKLSEAEEFPHEIGVFLGYPLPDVKAFIEEKGQNCLVSGNWKVYHDEQSAKCLFCKYKRCKEVYAKVYRKGRKLTDMLVSA